MSDSHLHDLAAQLVSAHQGTDVSDCIPGTFRPLQLGQLCNLQHSVDKMILFRLFQLQCAWLRGTELSESARHGESNCTPAPAAHSRPPQPHLEHRPPGHGHHRCRSRQPWTLIDHSSVLFRQGDTSHDWLEAFQVEQARACTKACDSLHTASHGYVECKPLACKGQLHVACLVVQRFEHAAACKRRVRSMAPGFAQDDGQVQFTCLSCVNSSVPNEPNVPILYTSRLS